MSSGVPDRRNGLHRAGNHDRLVPNVVRVRTGSWTTILTILCYNAQERRTRPGRTSIDRMRGRLWMYLSRLGFGLERHSVELGRVFECLLLDPKYVKTPFHNDSRWEMLTSHSSACCHSR